MRRLVMLYKLLCPPSLEINDFLAHPRLFGCKHYRVTSDNLIQVTSHEPPLRFLNGHLPTVSSLDSFHECLCKTEVSAAMRLVPFRVLLRDDMFPDRFICEGVNIDLPGVVTDLAMRAI